jgi:hypothetical protein
VDASSQQPEKQRHAFDVRGLHDIAHLGLRFHDLSHPLRKGRVEVRVVVASHPERVEILSHWVEIERGITNAVDPDGKGGNKQDTQSETQQERPSGEEPA